MLKNSLFATSCFLLAACHSSKPVVTIVTKDSTITKDTVIYKTITKWLPGDTVEIGFAIPCPDVKIDTVIRKGNTTLTANIDKGIVKMKCDSDSLKHIIDSVTRLKQKEVFKTNTIVQDKEVPKPYIPTWVWYLIAANIIAVAWKFRNPILSFIKNVLPK